MNSRKPKNLNEYGIVKEMKKNLTISNLSTSSSTKCIPKPTTTTKTTITTTLKENLPRNLKQSTTILANLSDNLSQGNIIIVLGLMLVSMVSILTLFILCIRKRNKVSKKSTKNDYIGLR